MRFINLTKRQQEQIVTEIMHGLCDSCEHEDNCIADDCYDCREHAREIAIQYGEDDGYVLVEDMDFGTRSVKLRSEIDDYDITIKE